MPCQEKTIRTIPRTANPPGIHLAKRGVRRKIFNTATTIITFLIVFLIQNTQNRDSEAMQLKLDELIRATKTSHNALLEIEELSDAELHKIKSNFAELANNARKHVRSGKSDLGSPEIKQES